LEIRSKEMAKKAPPRLTPTLKEEFAEALTMDTKEAARHPRESLD
jgi:hypothetical protein